MVVEVALIVADEVDAVQFHLVGEAVVVWVWQGGDWFLLTVLGVA
jgi:hypothetical protein